MGYGGHLGRGLLALCGILRILEEGMSQALHGRMCFVKPA